jgi:hypothetical protein
MGHENTRLAWCDGRVQRGHLVRSVSRPRTLPSVPIHSFWHRVKFVFREGHGVVVKVPEGSGGQPPRRFLNPPEVPPSPSFSKGGRFHSTWRRTAAWKTQTGWLSQQGITHPSASGACPSQEGTCRSDGGRERQRSRRLQGLFTHSRRTGTTWAN